MNKTHSRAAFRTITVHLGRSNLPVYFLVSKKIRKNIPPYNRETNLEIVV
jgi:hypothetical protein